MKLLSATIHGYKRFGKKSTINLDGKLIALIGPNEAGKSSLLNALQHFNNRDAFVKNGASQELTRGLTIPDSQTIIEATYLLEESDRHAISHIEDSSKIRWLIASKVVGGTTYGDVSPAPNRDLSRRKQVTKELQNARDLIKESGIKIGVQKKEDPLPQLETLISKLDVDSEQLTEEAVSELQAVSAMFLSSGLAAAIEPLQNLAKAMSALADDEKVSPSTSAMRLLYQRKPKFILFDEEARGLQSTYDLEKVGSSPPKALDNLTRVANLDLGRLMAALSINDEGQVETILEAANAHLKDVFSTVWSQANVAVRLRVTGKVLHVLVGSSETSYVAIAERSDGLRQYVALVAFIQLEKTDQSPVLLIDEAETHLHYDAQADLIQMFARQELATKVIYTTHSVGCLPEDLGTGVRLIEADSPTTSVIRNWFWETDQPGFSPLLFGIGAKTLAFLPVRFALITEGPTDIILLPTLFREATGRSSLGFQIVPGLSVADESEIGILENGAPRTAYLVDADKGGSELRRQLQRAEIPQERIFSLPDDTNVGIVLEDFVDADVYLGAVNEELKRSHGGAFSIASRELPATSKPKAIEEWCKAKGIKPPNKRAVAYRVIEKRVNHQILSKKYHSQIRQLYEGIEKALSLKRSLKP
jgi:predicted ATP-dependent endonuclease of OLD family